jgi:hypothetical protein
MQLAVLRQRLDGGDLLAADGADRDLARARGDAYLVPVNPTVSRMTQSSGVSDSTSTL